MDGYATAIAIIGSVGFISGGAASVIKTLYGKKVCDLHGALMSEIVSIKSATIKIAVYIADKSTEEGRNLNKEVMDSMMKR